MTGWAYTREPFAVGTRRTFRLRAHRAGAGLPVSLDPLDACLCARGGGWAIRLDLSGEVELDAVVPEVRSQRATVTGCVDARDLLAQWAVDCGCPAGIARSDPVLAACAWSPGPLDPEYDRAAAGMAAMLSEAMDRI